MVISGCPFLLLHYSRCRTRTRSLVLWGSNTLTWPCTVSVVYLISRPLFAFWYSIVIAYNMHTISSLQRANKNLFANSVQLEENKDIIFISILFYSIIFYYILNIIVLGMVFKCTKDPLKCKSEKVKVLWMHNKKGRGTSSPFLLKLHG